jgi:hypothetical protein
LGFWSRTQAIGRHGSTDVAVTVQPSFQVFAPGGGYIGYVGVHLSVFGQQGSDRSIGNLLAEDQDFCFPYR